MRRFLDGGSLLLPRLPALSLPALGLALLPPPIKTLLTGGILSTTGLL